MPGRGRGTAAGWDGAGVTPGWDRGENTGPACSFLAKNSRETGAGRRGTEERGRKGREVGWGRRAGLPQSPAVVCSLQDASLVVLVTVVESLTLPPLKLVSSSLPVGVWMTRYQYWLLVC